MRCQPYGRTPERAIQGTPTAGWRASSLSRVNSLRYLVAVTVIDLEAVLPSASQAVAVIV